MKITTMQGLEDARAQGERSLYPARTKITVGMATCGIASGAGAVYAALIEEVKNKRLDATVTRAGCIGYCQQEPLVDVLQPGLPRITFGQMTPKKARELVVRLLEKIDNN